MRQLKHIVAFCLAVSTVTLALANGEWHKRAERAGQIPSFPETSISKSAPQGYGQPESYQRGQSQQERASAVTLQRIDWSVVGVIALWLAALLCFIMLLKTRNQSKRALKSVKRNE